MLGENNHFLNLLNNLAITHHNRNLFSKIICLNNSFHKVKNLTRFQKYSRQKKKNIFKITAIKSTRFRSFLNAFNYNSEILIDKTINDAIFTAGWTYQLNSITLHFKFQKNASLTTPAFLKHRSSYFKIFLKTIFQKARLCQKFRLYVPILTYKGRIVLLSTGLLYIVRIRSLVEPYVKALRLAKHRILKHALIAKKSKPALNTLVIRYPQHYIYELKFRKKKTMRSKKLYPSKKRDYLPWFLFNQLKKQKRKFKNLKLITSFIKLRPSMYTRRKNLKLFALKKKTAMSVKRTKSKLNAKRTKKTKFKKN